VITWTNGRLLSAYVKRPNLPGVRLPVEARLTRTDGASSESIVTMALEAPNLDEDGVWHAEVCLTRSQAHLFAYMTLVQILRPQRSIEFLRGLKKGKMGP
jgi:hypothetical protein